MTLMVAYSHSPEGTTALEHGRDLAARLQLAVTVFDLDRQSHATDRHVDPVDDTAPAGERWLAPASTAPVPADDLLDSALELDAAMIVVGVRRRSPVGKLIMGSLAQRIILGAAAPVVAVKAPAGAE